MLAKLWILFLQTVIVPMYKWMNNVNPTYRNGTRGDPESYRLAILASIAVKEVMFLTESEITESPNEHGLRQKESAQLL